MIDKEKWKIGTDRDKMEKLIKYNISVQYPGPFHAIIARNHLIFFQNIFRFCTFLPKFSNILPFFAFNIFLHFFWKITHMLLLSRIGPDIINCVCRNSYFSMVYFAKIPINSFWLVGLTCWASFRNGELIYS